MDYFDRHGAANAKLEWQSASEAREVVPQSQLFSALPPGTIAINFQDGTSAGRPGYLPDRGAAFGKHANGQTYGWNKNNSANGRNRNAQLIQDERFDTFALMQNASNPDATWDMAVANGTYQVRVVAGDPTGTANALYKINVEGMLAVDSVVPPAVGEFFDGTVTVTVTDGRLTITNATGSINNKICFIEITPV